MYQMKVIIFLLAENYQPMYLSYHHIKLSPNRFLQSVDLSFEIILVLIICSQYKIVKFYDYGIFLEWKLLYISSFSSKNYICVKQCKVLVLGPLH